MTFCEMGSAAGLTLRLGRTDFEILRPVPAARGLNGMTLPVFEFLMTSSFALIVGLNLPRTQLNARAETMSSSTPARADRSISFNRHTTFALFPFTHFDRLCRFISDTIDAVSPTQLTVWCHRPVLSAFRYEKIKTAELSVIDEVIGYTSKLYSVREPRKTAVDSFRIRFRGCVI